MDPRQWPVRLERWWRDLTRPGDPAGKLGALRFLRSLHALVPLLVVLALSLDGLRYAYAGLQLTRALQRSADAAARVAKERPGRRDDAGVAAAVAAAEAGGVCYAYHQDDRTVHVWVRVPVERTLVVGPVEAAFAGRPLAHWWSSPPTMGMSLMRQYAFPARETFE